MKDWQQGSQQLLSGQVNSLRGLALANISGGVQVSGAAAVGRVPYRQAHDLRLRLRNAGTEPHPLYPCPHRRCPSASLMPWFRLQHF